MDRPSNQLFASNSFVDFGPNFLMPFAPRPPVEQIEGKKKRQLRDQLRHFGPKQPGVYGMLNHNGDVTYIGKAKNLRKRLMNYFQPSNARAKSGRIIATTVRIVWEVSPTEFAALHRELELIRRWRPRFNVKGQPTGRRPIYLCLGRKPAPFVFLAKKPPKDAMASYGPIPTGKMAKEGVRRINDYFRLRDCPQSQTMHFADQGELFPVEYSPGCIRYDLGTCTGPCAAECTRGDYFKQVRATQRFLEGQDTSALSEILTDLERAATEHQYERAAALRDKLVVLQWVYEQLTQMRKMKAAGSFVYPLQGDDGQTLWYLIHQGQTVAAIQRPSNDASRRDASKLIENVYSDRDMGTRQQRLARRDSILLVASWFQSNPEELLKVMSPTEALKAVETVRVG